MQSSVNPKKKYIPPGARSTSLAPVGKVASLEEPQPLPNPNPSLSTATGNHGSNPHNTPEFGIHSPKSPRDLSPVSKLQQVFKQESLRLESEEGSLAPQDELEHPNTAMDATNQTTHSQGTASISHDSRVSEPQLLQNSKGTSYRAGDPNLGYSADTLKPHYTNASTSTVGAPLITIQRTSSPLAPILVQNPSAATKQNGATSSKSPVLETTKPLPASKPPASKAPPTRDWASLFRSQGPSKSMKMSFYPELRQGKSAVVKLDASHIDEDSWNHCLVGYFLEGKMDFPLVNSTAHKLWGKKTKFGLESVRIDVSGFIYFEFQDEESKMAVLEGGPWFFSKKYIVLKTWRRMMTPIKEPPSTIPAWVKLHKLPPECWTEDGLSRIASTIGIPIHVDKATARRSRLGFARICIEIEAGVELPDEIQVTVEGDSAFVYVEYQWLPPICPVCKVFGHSRCSKSARTNSVVALQTLDKGKATTVSLENNPPEEWQVIGRVAALNRGGISALEAVTKFVPTATNTALLGSTSAPIPRDDDDMSEALDDEFEIMDAGNYSNVKTSTEEVLKAKEIAVEEAAANKPVCAPPDSEQPDSTSFKEPPTPEPNSTPITFNPTGGGDPSTTPIHAKHSSVELKNTSIEGPASIDQDTQRTQDSGKGIEDSDGSKLPDPPDDNQGWSSNKKKNKKKSKQEHKQKGNKASPFQKR